LRMAETLCFEVTALDFRLRRNDPAMEAKEWLFQVYLVLQHKADSTTSCDFYSVRR